MTLAAERADLPAPGCSAIRRPARKKAGKTHASPPSEAFSNSRRDIPCPVPTASREKHHFRLGYEKSGLVSWNRSAPDLRCLWHSSFLHGGGSSSHRILQRLQHLPDKLRLVLDMPPHHIVIFTEVPLLSWSGRLSIAPCFLFMMSTSARIQLTLSPSTRL